MYGRCAALDYKRSFFLDSLYVTSTVDTQQYSYLGFDNPMETSNFGAVSHMEVTKLISYYCCRLYTIQKAYNNKKSKAFKLWSGTEVLDDGRNG